MALRTLAMWRTGLLTAPVHLVWRAWLPAPAPAIALSLHGGWTGVSGAAARDAMTRLGVRVLDPDPLVSYAPASTVTGNARVTAAIGLRFFGGAIGFGVARPLDHAAPWCLELQGGQLF